MSRICRNTLICLEQIFHWYNPYTTVEDVFDPIDAPAPQPPPPLSPNTPIRKTTQQQSQPELTTKKHQPNLNRTKCAPNDMWCLACTPNTPKSGRHIRYCECLPGIGYAFDDDAHMADYTEYLKHKKQSDNIGGKKYPKPKTVHFNRWCVMCASSMRFGFITDCIRENGTRHIHNLVMGRMPSMISSPPSKIIASLSSCTP